MLRNSNIANKNAAPSLSTYSRFTILIATKAISADTTIDSIRREVSDPARLTGRLSLRGIGAATSDGPLIWSPKRRGEDSASSTSFAHTKLAIIFPVAAGAPVRSGQLCADGRRPA